MLESPESSLFSFGLEPILLYIMFFLCVCRIIFAICLRYNNDSIDALGIVLGSVVTHIITKILFYFIYYYLPEF